MYRIVTASALSKAGLCFLGLFLLGCAPAATPESQNCIDTTEGRYCYVERDGRAYFGGDMILGSAERMAEIKAKQSGSRFAYVDSVSLRNTWLNGIVPYTIDEGVDARTIEGAISIVNGRTSARFVPRTNERDYVTFTLGSDESACYSFLGRIGGQQFIYLTPSGDCGITATIHEMGHTLGLLHEHQRPDRDNFVTVHDENILPERKDAFAKVELLPTSRLSQYDFNSVMHYPAEAFSVGGDRAFTFTCNEKYREVCRQTCAETGEGDIYDFLSERGLYFCPSRDLSEADVISINQLVARTSIDIAGTWTYRLNGDVVWKMQISFDPIRELATGDIRGATGSPSFWATASMKLGPPASYVRESFRFTGTAVQVAPSSCASPFTSFKLSWSVERNDPKTILVNITESDETCGTPKYLNLSYVMTRD